ncbi:hypothetical protein [Ideonella sp. A 288]|uniref:hypothetical protein n=1 Tax=Ideonella sp. A 288 TaxID=1962181 RepID=UPI000B4A619A|nr:hypothetical protein [Ideonella sp. A 288]
MTALDRRLATARQRAIRKGMRFIAEAAADDALLAHLGTGLLYSLRSMARTSADDALRRTARLLGRHAFALWERSTLEAADFRHPDWVAEAVRGYGAGEGLGLRREGMREWLVEAARPFGSRAFIGFDADRGPPAVAREGAYRTWCIGLTSAWCGERYGVPLGARYADVLCWLPRMRPYDIAWRQSRRRFHDVAYSVTHVVYTLNDYGHSTLDPRWLPDEYMFLRAALPEAIADADADLTGELLDTLRAFGVPHDDTQVRMGAQFLVDSQNADGSWGTWDADSFYTGFHAAWAAIDGLRDYRWTGPRLAFPEVLPQLQAWARRA